MVDGRLRRFYQERVLLEQQFVKGDESIKDLLARVGKAAGGTLNLLWFERLQVGG